MIPKKYIFISFILVALVQIAVPVHMILDHEDILNTGKEFRFKSKLTYPDSDISGKYIHVSYDQDKYPVLNDSMWVNGESVYVVFEEGPSGFAEIDTLLKSEPDYTPNFVEANIRYAQKEETYEVILEYPFEKFWLEESRLSEEAMNDLRYRTERAQSIQSIIRVHSGKAAIKDILIDGESILNL